MTFPRDWMFRRFQLYGFLKNLRFFDPFLILFFREMGFSFLDIGLLYSIREICTNILEIPTGVLADAFGRRRAMIASFSAYLASFALFYLFPRFWVYALAMVLFALGETFRSGTHKAMILEYLRIKKLTDQRVSYYGHTRAASQFGSAIASLGAAGLVFYAGSYRIVFLASMVPYVLELFLMISYPKALDGERHVATGPWSRRLTGQIATTGKDFLAALRQPALLKGLFSSAGFDAMFRATKDYLQPILQVQALALPVLLSFEADRRVAVVVGVLYFFIYLATCCASAQAGRVQGWLRSLPFAINASYLAGAALLVAAGAAAWIDIPGVAIAAFLGVYALQNLRRPMLVGYLSELMSHRTMATGLSVESQLRTLLVAGLAPLVGFLADRFGVGIGILAIALGAMALLPLVRVSKVDRANG